VNARTVGGVGEFDGIDAPFGRGSVISPPRTAARRLGLDQAARKSFTTTHW
jgi:hypothetical protein